jgi:hypothetical protein
MFGSTPEQPKQLHSTNSEIFSAKHVELQLLPIWKKIGARGQIHFFLVPQGVFQKPLKGCSKSYVSDFPGKLQRHWFTQRTGSEQIKTSRHPVASARPPTRAAAPFLEP